MFNTRLILVWKKKILSFPYSFGNSNYHILSEKKKFLLQNMTKPTLDVNRIKKCVYAIEKLLSGQVINKGSNYMKTNSPSKRGVKIYLYKGFLFRTFCSRSKPKNMQFMEFDTTSNICWYNSTTSKRHNFQTFSEPNRWKPTNECGKKKCQSCLASGQKKT